METIFLGGEYGGRELPSRLNPEKIYYDASMIVPYPADYVRQLAPLNIQMKQTSLRAPINIFSNYFDYNDNVQKYQDWSSNLESELLMPNHYVVTDYYQKYRTDYWAD